MRLNEPLRFDPKTALAGVCWDTQGNAGTNADTDFAGTTDNQPLVLKSPSGVVLNERGPINADVNMGSTPTGDANFNLSLSSRSGETALITVDNVSADLTLQALGSGIALNGPIRNASFGSETRQMLNLWGPANYGIGVQDFNLYARSAGGFLWFEGGIHADAAGDPGAGGTTRMHLRSDGQLFTTTGTIATLSDDRLKNDVDDYRGALNQIKALRPVHYRCRDAGQSFQPIGAHLGFIAQEAQAVFPQWVSGDESGYLSLSMRGFEAVAVRAIQELDIRQASELRAVQAENAELRLASASLAARLDALEAKDAP